MDLEKRYLIAIQYLIEELINAYRSELYSVERAEVVNWFCNSLEKGGIKIDYDDKKKCFIVNNYEIYCDDDGIYIYDKE